MAAPFVGSWRTILQNVFAALEYLGAAGAFTNLKHSASWFPLSGILAPAGTFVFVSILGDESPSSVSRVRW
mgnify:CR=1 FL=1|jgi:hypothetical protein